MTATFLLCSTLVVPQVQAAVDRYTKWLDYSVVEHGELSADLAASWLSPGSAGKKYAVLKAASGADVFLRFVEGDDVPEYEPMRTHGWAATEICVKDVEAVNTRMLASPFEIIGPPKPLDGFPTVKPMQVRGPDREIVYLTEILIDDPNHGLPTVQSLIDRPFIMVLACSNLQQTIGWANEVFALPISTPVTIKYSLLSAAFGLHADSKHALCIVKGAGQTFLEFDQYPDGATARPRNAGELPPGVAVTTMLFPDFQRLAGHWAVQPVVRNGAIYGGRRVGILETPDGALLEVVET
jgi:catechol 2,3-dioxygenase-like lactoylglutathione lyase family enzyme